MEIITIVLILICGINLLFFTLTYIVIMKYRKGSKFNFAVFFHLNSICVISSISNVIYGNTQLSLNLANSFLSLVGDFGKIITPIMILVIIGVVCFYPEKYEQLQKLIVFSMFFFHWIIPLSIATASVIIGVFWLQHTVLYIIVVTLRYVLIICYISLSIKIEMHLKKQLEEGEEIGDFFDRFKKIMSRHRKSVVFNFFVLLYLSIIDIISATKKNFDPYICYTIGQILYTFLPSLYVLSIVYNKERWRLLILAMTCKDEREEIYETSSIF